ARRAARVAALPAGAVRASAGAGVAGGIPAAGATVRRLAGGARCNAGAGGGAGARPAGEGGRCARAGGRGAPLGMRASGAGCWGALALTPTYTKGQASVYS